MMDQVAPILSVVALEKSFGGVQAVRGAEFDVQEGSITALIGPNGAGKSTVVNLIAGALHPDAGHVHFRVPRLQGVSRSRSLDTVSFAPSRSRVSILH